MKSKQVLWVIVFMLVFGVGAANAGVSSYYIDIVQGGSQDVTGMDNIVFDVVFNADQGQVMFGNYGFNLVYDTGELTWNPGATVITPPSPLLSIPTPFGAPFEMVPGLIEAFNGSVDVYAGSEPAYLNGSVTLASVAFDVNNPGVNLQGPDSFFDVFFDIGSPTSVGTGFTVDDSFIPIDQMYVAGPGPDVYTTAIVPEPVSSALFVIGAATLGFRRFRKTITN